MIHYKTFLFLSVLWNTCLDCHLLSAIDPFPGFANNIRLLVFSSHVEEASKRCPPSKLSLVLMLTKSLCLLKFRQQTGWGYFFFRLTSIESLLSLCSHSSADIFHYLSYIWVLNSDIKRVLCLVGWGPHAELVSDSCLNTIAEMICYYIISGEWDLRL